MSRAVGVLGSQTRALPVRFSPGHNPKGTLGEARYANGTGLRRVSLCMESGTVPVGIGSRHLALDFRNLMRGELIAGLAGVALFVIMLVFKWYGLKFDPPTGTAELGIGTQEAATDNAFQAFTVIDLVLLLTALSAVALPLWSALGRPVIGYHRPGSIVAALGGLAFVLIAFRLISPPDLEIAIPDGGSVDVSDFPDPTRTRLLERLARGLAW